MNDCFRRVLHFRYYTCNLGGDRLQACLETPIVCMSMVRNVTRPNGVPIDSWD
ncbi:hypothetical protein NEUTE2DRAFT_143176 [Neurospora tetrasperma FGSC 2509]|nr:hypothetical protein NEUTE2DRAFT_143176 [Neurospora tetrasperma FGSC 2509]